MHPQLFVKNVATCDLLTVSGKKAILITYASS